GDDGINVAWRHTSLWHASSENPKQISIHDTHRYMTVDAAEALAADLLAAAAAARADAAEGGAK
ncbi:hypothetical protein, partial [Mycolicibacterium llatzerense]|uniref:hypothetical protein n=1 Tax=Mycolicibacterium llatzerense TaxID=280871 RepID=UPI0021B50240